MDALSNMAGWRAAWPEVSKGLDRVVDAALPSGYSRPIVWGSVALGDYVHGQSDVDLLLVHPGRVMPMHDSACGAIAPSPGGKMGPTWAIEALGITEEALARHPKRQGCRITAERQAGRRQPVAARQERGLAEAPSRRRCAVPPIRAVGRPA
jgi:hypothetical protein